MRWGKTRLSGGVVAFVFISLLLLCISVGMLAMELTGAKYPTFKQPAEPKERKRGRH